MLAPFQQQKLSRLHCGTIRPSPLEGASHSNLWRVTSRFKAVDDSLTLRNSIFQKRTFKRERKPDLNA